MCDEQSSDDLRPLEAVLHRLVPSPVRIDEARLMFLAGQESVRTESRRDGRASRPWRWAAAFSSALALMLAAVLVARPQPQPVIVYRDAAPPAAQPQSTPEVPAAAPERPRARPAADPWAALVANWLPVDGRRQRQLAEVESLEVASIDSSGASSFPPIAQRELLNEYLRERGLADARQPAAFPWPLPQSGVQ